MSISRKEEKIAHLTERYKVEMHIQRAKLKAIQTTLNHAIKNVSLVAKIRQLIVFTRVLECFDFMPNYSTDTSFVNA